MTKEQQEKLKPALEDIIRQVNRCLYEWNDPNHKKYRKYTIEYRDVRALTSNWLVKTLKAILGVYNTTALFRKGTPIVTIDEKTNAVKSITLCTVSMYSVAHIREDIQGILDKIDYSSLVWSPTDEKPVFNPSPIEEVNLITIEPDLSFNSIRNFKF